MIVYNFELDFDRYFFRAFDVVRVILKRIFTRLCLRNKQSCKYCGRDQNIIWTIKNEIWNELPIQYKNKSLCIECFARLIKDNSISLGDFVTFQFIKTF